MLVTEPYFNFSSIKDTMNEIFFEDYQVAGLVRTNRMFNFEFVIFKIAAFLGAYKYRVESAKRLSRYCLVVDSGYSFTHIVPIVDGSIMKDFVIRYVKLNFLLVVFLIFSLTVGGKILTNRLIEAISYR